MIFRSLIISPAAIEDVDYVARRMRAADRRDVYGVRFSDDPESLVDEVKAQLRHYAPICVIRRRAHPRPVAIAGILLAGPGVGLANLIATDEWPRVVKDVTRWIRQMLIPDCLAAGFNRVEIRCLKEFSGTCRWLEALGAEFETDCPGFDKQGGLFSQYAWVRS